MLWLPIDRSSNLPLIQQVYQQIHDRILSGELSAGQRLPATRELAASLQVSRNVVLQAYDQLFAEGYIEGRQGSGTYVAQGTYLAQAQSEPPALGFELTSSTEPTKTDVIDFRSGVPALEYFPRKLWAQLTKRICETTSHSQFGYGVPEGCIELREVLSRYLLRTRGVRCHPDQIIITSGASQAFGLVEKLLLSSAGEVIIEDPITWEIPKILSSSGATIYPIPVDENGLQTSLIPKDKKPHCVFVTPSHQFPLGSILPIQRRIELIQFARETGCFIVEDDYDSEFRYEGIPISSLQGLDPECVIYVGTFSKILSPALRLGYLVLPSALTLPCRHLKRFSDLHTSSLEQLTLALMIEEGHLERHIAKTKRLYRKRRNALIVSLRNHFPGEVKILGDSTGLHLVAEFANVEFSDEMLRRVEQHQVQIYPVEIHAIEKGKHCNQVILGYGNVSPADIEVGIARLKAALSAV
jgi:GntR family transcriptional regulator/MocR family aminotransferase